MGMSSPFCSCSSSSALLTCLYRLILAGKGHAERRDDADGVLVAVLDDLLRGQQETVALDRNLAQFHIPIPAEFVPAHLHRALSPGWDVPWTCLRPAASPAISISAPCAAQHRGLTRSRGGSADGVGGLGACQRSASMCTQRASISADCGYSSLSIMFLSMHLRHQLGRPRGSDHVWQKVARFWRELPSSISSS